MSLPSFVCLFLCDTGIDFGVCFKECTTRADRKLMNKIETRKPLCDKEKKILQDKLFEQFNVDIENDSPLKLFGHIGNFAAAHTCWARRNPMA